MHSNDVSRSTFKNNFLKHIIMRLDFQGVLPSEMECVLCDVKKYLKELNFSRYEEKIGNEIELNIDSNILDIHAPVKDVRQTKIFSFYNENNGYAFDLSTNFLILKVNATKYAPFEDYSKVFVKLCEIYKSKIDFFTYKRLGFRKINFCFLKDIKLVGNYFNEKYYRCHDLFDDAIIIASTKRTCIEKNNFKINITYGVEQGKVENDMVYKIILDSDIYCEDAGNISQVLFESERLAEMNNILFNIYTDSITNEMADVLKNDIGDVPSILLGVESNE